MEILTYTPEHEDFRHRLRIFCDTEVTPYVDRWEADRIVPKSVWHKMGQGGFLCPAVDPEYGGLGGDFRYSVIVAEELSRTAHTGLAAGLHSDVVVPYIESYGSESVKRRYLPLCVSGKCITAVGMTEPDAGSDLANRTADRSLSILGDFGTVESCPLVRAWRDMRVMSIFAGTNDIMKGIAAKFMGL